MRRFIAPSSKPVSTASTDNKVPYGTWNPSQNPHGLLLVGKREILVISDKFTVGLNEFTSRVAYMKGECESSYGGNFATLSRQKIEIESDVTSASNRYVLRQTIACRSL